MKQLPVILTCGEPAGIGVELVHKAWKLLRNEICFIWIGDPKHLDKNQPYKLITKPLDAIHIMPEALPVIEHSFKQKVKLGLPNKAHANTVVEVIEKAVNLIKDKQGSSLCTLPIHKQVLKDGANFQYPGHTEFLASLTEADHVVMLLSGPNLKVVPASIHIPLRDVSNSLNASELEKTISVTRRAMIEKFAILNPRIAVSGLNPHAGENGKFGQEEMTIISPLINKLRAKKWIVTVPHTADTLFYKEARAKYDVAIAMYHDQALIPVKTLDFDSSVNVTLGLPFVRTSPDHGPALDIAGKAMANPTSTIEALRLAARLSKPK